MAKAHMLADDARPLPEILEEALAVLRQDGAEYMYIGLVGAVAAALSVLVPGLFGGPVGLSLVAPLVVLAAVFTYATSTAALCVGANHLQPDAGTAAITALRRSIGVLMPWLPLIIGLWAASYAGAAFAHYMGPVPHVLVVIALVAAAVWYAFPRVIAAPALFDQELSWRQADAVSATIVQASPRRIAVLWLTVLLPAILMSLLGLATGLDTVSGAVAVFLAVAALPVASAIMTLWFFDAASRIDVAPVADPRRGSPQRI